MDSGGLEEFLDTNLHSDQGVGTKLNELLCSTFNMFNMIGIKLNELQYVQYDNLCLRSLTSRNYNQLGF